MDENFFRQVIELLQRAKIPFWLDYGSLLGLIRDNRPIPWDTDFDLSVWTDRVTADDIRQAMNSAEFRIISLFRYGIEGLHILPLDQTIKGKVDIVFYTRKQDRAVHCTFVPPSGVWTELLASIERFFDPEIKAKEKYKYYLELLFDNYLSRLIPAAIKRKIGRVFNLLMRRNYGRGLRLVYDFPAHYFDNLRQVSFLGVNINIPADTENYLESAYGKDWRIPKQWQDWYQGATYVE